MNWVGEGWRVGKKTRQRGDGELREKDLQTQNKEEREGRGSHRQGSLVSLAHVCPPPRLAVSVLCLMQLLALLHCSF